MSFNDKISHKYRIIGITGSIGSGKSYVSNLFKKEGFQTLDADEIYHYLTDRPTNLTKSISDEFGNGVLNHDGSLNRAALSEIVFNDDDKLLRLNEITHGIVIDTILEKCEEYYANGITTIIVEVPLMFESGFDKHCSDIIFVTANEKIRIERIMARNGFTEDEAKKRIKKQKNIDLYIEKCDYILYNNDDVELLAAFLRIFMELFYT